EALTDELIKGYRRYHLKGSEVGQLADFMDKLSRGVVLGDESIQATIVKEGDQLAIGDRILQIGENIGGEVHYEVRDSVTGPVHSGTGDIVINPEQDLEAIFEKLRRLVAAQPRLPPAEQEEITGKLSELQSELAGPEPDLGTIQRLKKFLSEKGPWMAAGINALFSNPSVVQVVKQAAQRLLGA
ncbi:MAG: hypothetical protein GTO63_04635, partial [Anaerolineae bacterium]|nr:hypothetical protein [Anaerolineae bacterium]NIN94291.1 hypothetical protein [Anaerolineae bacterium]